MRSRAVPPGGTIYYPPRRAKPHLWVERGYWWVFDPVNLLPLGPYQWRQVVLVARSCIAQVREMGL